MFILNENRVVQTPKKGAYMLLVSLGCIRKHEYKSYFLYFFKARKHFVILYLDPQVSWEGHKSIYLGEGNL